MYTKGEIKNLVPKIIVESAGWILLYGRDAGESEEYSGVVAESGQQVQHAVCVRLELHQAAPEPVLPAARPRPLPVDPAHTHHPELVQCAVIADGDVRPGQALTGEEHASGVWQPGHQVGLAGEGQVDGAPAVHQTLQVRVAIRDDRDLEAGRHACPAVKVGAEVEQVTGGEQLPALHRLLTAVLASRPLQPTAHHHVLRSIENTISLY